MLLSCLLKFGPSAFPLHLHSLTDYFPATASEGGNLSSKASHPLTWRSPTLHHTALPLLCGQVGWGLAALVGVEIRGGSCGGGSGEDLGQKGQGGCGASHHHGFQSRKWPWAQPLGPVNLREVNPIPCHFSPASWRPFLHPAQPCIPKAQSGGGKPLMPFDTPSPRLCQAGGSAS